MTVFYYQRNIETESKCRGTLTSRQLFRKTVSQK